jgi:hypothetical protein
MTARQAYPPPLTAVQLGPTVRPGVCALAPKLGCGLLPARFYIGGWRCDGHQPGTVVGRGAG